MDAHVRLEDDDNCLEDTELKYVYVVRECARDVYTTHTMHTQSTPLPGHEVQSCDEEQEREHRSARDAREVRALRRPLALPARFLARLRGPGRAAPHPPFFASLHPLFSPSHTTASRSHSASTTRVWPRVNLLHYEHQAFMKAITGWSEDAPRPAAYCLRRFGGHCRCQTSNRRPLAGLRSACASALLTLTPLYHT